ncbi:hypothetical protein AMJ74_04680 [candidate division WOR_3 bacterium SM1_77]|uniref:DUF2905 domain-containing protein n=1 Tax=candidate division WOR_3 bacterium SM1_77 TaxID=1703778 RepID=A0A0S8JV53_UNCW3|nr:MAG: hypothetical protein AMJ74_04680 [candidate division WOR_3 bacterium SM1_77]
MPNIARFLIILGVVFIMLGVVFLLFPRIPLFKLPGDFILKKDNLVLVFPIATSILLSIIVTIIINLLLRK